MKPEAPVVTIAIEKPSQLADSLANTPVRIEYKVNQVSFSCELVTALHVALLVLYTVSVRNVQCGMLNAVWNDSDVKYSLAHMCTFILYCMQTHVTFVRGDS